MSDATQLIKFPVADTAIAELSKKYLPLKVTGINDQQGLAAVHDARMEVKSLRVAVEKKRKELKADALAFGQKVDTEAKRLTGLLAPIEEHLEEQESVVEKEKRRLAQIEEEKRVAKIDARLKALADCETMVNPQAVAGMSDEDFAKLLELSQNDFAERQEQKAEAERQRIAAETKAKEEAARLAAERAELAKQKATQEAEAARIRKEQEEKAAAERAELDKARKAQEAELAEIRKRQNTEQERLNDERRQIELEKAKREAAERARVETEQRIARERAEAEEAERRAKAEAELKAAAEEAERVREEALRPDRVKLLAVADAVKAIDLPAVSDAAGAAQQEISELLEACERNIRNVVARELPEPAKKAKREKATA